MKLPILLSLLCCGMYSVSLHAQDERPFRQYATQKVYQQLLAQNASFAENNKAMEEQIKLYGTAGDERADTIPIIFHIIYPSGQPFLEESQIQAQIEALNRDFELYHPPLEPYSLDKVQEQGNKFTNPKIVFCLPPSTILAPIRYIETASGPWKYENDAIKFSELGGADVVDPSHFLNVWVGDLAGSFGGYSQLPGGPQISDGIVIDQRYFGVESGTFTDYYTEGKTLTHLIGSYLGLYELWNETEPCKDDFVEDTPLHNVPNFHPGDISWHVSLCDESMQTEMIMNFMDNTDDRALNMFTQGQKNRMKAVLSETGLRSELRNGGAICKADNLYTIDDRSGKNNNPLAQSRASFKLFPNPATDMLNLEIQATGPESVTLTAYNMLGGLVWSSATNVTEDIQVLRTDCSGWGHGGYIVRAVFGNGTVISQKVFVD